MGIAAPGGEEGRDRRVEDVINYTPALRPQMEKKLHEYQQRLRGGEFVDNDDWLSDKVKETIILHLQAKGFANYQEIKSAAQEAYGEKFNPHVFDESWLVIQWYLSGKGDELVGGTGLA